MKTYIVFRIGEFPEFMGQFYTRESVQERIDSLVLYRQRKTWSAGLPLYLITLEDGIYMGIEKF